MKIWGPWAPMGPPMGPVPPGFFREPGGRGELAEKSGGPGAHGGAMGPHGPQIYIILFKIVNLKDI